MARRGELTHEINDKAKELIGRELSLTELRLIPYIQYVMVNERKIDPRKCNEDDRKILQKWRKEGYIEGGASGLAITKEFWDFMCEILFIAYVGYDN